MEESRSPLAPIHTIDEYFAARDRRNDLRDQWEKMNNHEARSTMIVIKYYDRLIENYENEHPEHVDLYIRCTI